MEIVSVKEYKPYHFEYKYKLEDSDAEQHIVDYYQGRILTANSHCACCGRQISLEMKKAIKHCRVSGSWCMYCLIRVNNAVKGGGTAYKLQRMAHNDLNNV